MLLERIYDEDLAQASYFIGCQAKGEALVVDARRDIQVYQDLAAKNGMKITAVTETHIHADYLSGTRELAAATGAAIYVSGEGGPDWQYEFEAERLLDQSTITLGNITATALHTPGHTPEHLSFLVTDGAFSDKPGFLLSGDFVFSGDLGRPDLLDEAAGGIDTRFAGAHDLFVSLQEKFLTLPDYVQVYPGHGAGSACGKALGAIPSSTVGYERSFAWWGPYLEANDEAGFVEALLDGQPDAHAYFGRMKRENRQGPAILGERAPLAELATADVATALAADDIGVVDTRPHTQVHQGTVSGALNIPAGTKAASYGAWAVDPETDQRPLVLLAPDSESAMEMWDHLIRVGIDNVAGYVTSFEGLPTYTPQTLDPADLAGFDAAIVLDVRNKSEHTAGHIPGSEQLNAGRVLWHTDQLPADGVIVSYCQSGVRNSVAASALRRAGFDVIELEGSYAGWSSWKQTQDA
ncbi:MULTISPECIES: MBL fold metallo-hydrolase [Paeniglutamicibacter]|uniref:MBL fold metallo-hydrolase n=2 Tax=Paeniglutamicibacter TaxID=1742990 RepID=A0A5B0ECR5_9MICC|nr:MULTISPECIES: MBL fold metallo-hydrolase [Paeniglutamicibacter]KAA0976528.1 MBL fold metallo-hydrolase [Paeniglutamicibacter gangotriensis]MDO2934101.1 MBL fold metallo-hydrolase [Paeniglutamicibacter sulfureus]NKG21810.1 MBL fold metallo-hydrolase [Paeniglutamicibacter terrestris]